MQVDSESLLLKTRKYLLSIEKINTKPILRDIWIAIARPRSAAFSRSRPPPTLAIAFPRRLLMLKLRKMKLWESLGNSYKNKIDFRLLNYLESATMGSVLSNNQKINNPSSFSEIELLKLTWIWQAERPASRIVHEIAFLLSFYWQWRSLKSLWRLSPKKF